MTETAPVSVPAWFKAVKNNDYKAVEKMLKSGNAPLNALDNTGNTALMRACVNGQLLDLLLRSRRIDVNAGTHSTPLHISCKRRPVKAAEQLVLRGALVNALDRDQQSPLHAACANNDTAVVPFLLRHGADPSLRDKLGQMPLHIALANRKEDTMLLLLQLSPQEQLKGLQPVLQPMRHINTISWHRRNHWPASVPSHSGAPFLECLPDDALQLILSMVQGVGLLHIFRRLNKHCFQLTNDPELWRCFLFDANSIAPAPNPLCKPCPVLHAATAKGMERVVKWLVLHSVDVTAIDSDNNTALHIAMQQGNRVIASLLLQAGARVDVCNAAKQTPLDMASASTLEQLRASSQEIDKYLESSPGK